MKEFHCRSMIDFGCGPATAGAAAYQVFNLDSEDSDHQNITKNEKNTLNRYVGIDMSQSMLDAAQIMTQDLFSSRVFYRRSSDFLQQLQRSTMNTNGKKNESSSNSRYDLIVASYTLTELASDEARLAAVQLLYELLAVDGVLVIIEQGNPFGSHTVRSAREFILESFNNVDPRGKFVLKYHGNDETKKEEEETTSNPKHKKRKEDSQEQTRYMILPPPMNHGDQQLSYNQLGASTLAPCTHDKRCPLALGTWCSFSQRVRGGVIHQSSEDKFSYVIMQKTTTSTNTRSDYSSHWLEDQRVKVTTDNRFMELNLDLTGDQITTEKLMQSSPQRIIQYLHHMRKMFEIIEKKKSSHDHSDEDIAKADKFITKFTTAMDGVDWDSYGEHSVEVTKLPSILRGDYARVIRSPLKLKGHVTFDVCYPSGKLQRRTISRANLDSLRLQGLYSAARKMTWGGLIPTAFLYNNQQVKEESKQEANKLLHAKKNSHPVGNRDSFRGRRSKLDGALAKVKERRNFE